MRISPREGSLARETGFTLIELMVVMAIMGILAALILTVLNRGRESANTVRCAGNLGQIGQAISAYAGDNEGRLPGPLEENQSNKISEVGDGSLLVILRRYLQVEGSDGRVNQAGVFTCPSWEAKDRSRKSPVFQMNVGDRISDMDNRIPWGGRGDDPVKMVNLVGWNPRPRGGVPVGLSEIWAMRDSDFAPDPGVSVHGDFRNALFYDWHVGRINLRNEPK